MWAGGLMMPDSSPRFALLIDGAYLTSAAKALGFEVDFKRLLEEFKSQGKVVRAALTTPRTKISPMRRFDRCSIGSPVRAM